MAFRGVQRSKCPKFGKIRGEIHNYALLLGFLALVSCSARMPLFSRISPDSNGDSKEL